MKFHPLVLSSFIPIQAASAATLISEGSFQAPMTGGGSLISGHFFLETGETTATYELWSGEVGDDSFTLLGSNGDSFSLTFNFPRTVMLEGCDLDPRNPFLPALPLSEFLWPIHVCDALKYYTVYSGVMDDPDLINLLHSGQTITAQVQLDFPGVAGPATATLTTIPEPSLTTLLSLVALGVTMKRRRVSSIPR